MAKSAALRRRKGRGNGKKKGLSNNRLVTENDTQKDDKMDYMDKKPLLSPPVLPLAHNVEPVIQPTSSRWLRFPRKLLTTSTILYLFFFTFALFGTMSAVAPTRHRPLATIGVPLPCHSHNDYWRRRPLFDALEAGCTGVEADVWLRHDDLYVAHNPPAGVMMPPTFTRLYIEPLVRILTRRNPSGHGNNGVFTRDTDQTLVLLVDLKEGGDDVVEHVLDQLDPLRANGWLTQVDNGRVIPGPITVVLTGEATLDQILSLGEVRDVFLDAPILALPDDIEYRYNFTNSYYASAKFGRAFGPVSGYMSPPEGVERLVEAAKERGLMSRFWSQPAWPRRARDRVWGDLLERGVDFLNVDDLVGVNRWFAAQMDDDYESKAH